MLLTIIKALNIMCVAGKAKGETNMPKRKPNEYVARYNLSWGRRGEERKRAKKARRFFAYGGAQASLIAEKVAQKLRDAIHREDAYARIEVDYALEVI